ncbi:hypothetical protein E4U58_005761, partial [Claviceps cyperi]
MTGPAQGGIHFEKDGMFMFARGHIQRNSSCEDDMGPQSLRIAVSRPDTSPVHAEQS